MNEFIIKIIQPIIRVKPPIGVIGPRNEKLIFVIDCVERRKMLNEKRTIPSNIELIHFPYNLTSGEKKKALVGVLSPIFWQELYRLYFRYKRTLNKGIFATMIFSLY